MTVAPSYLCRWLSRAVAALALLVAPLAAAPQFVRDAELIGRVIALMDRRLALMPEVAATKFREGRPITDPVREREVIAQSVAEAQALQLDPEAARAFFALQIELASTVQEHLVARWRASSASPPPARDLLKEIRPELDALGRELLTASYLASPALAAAPQTTLRNHVADLRRHAGITDAQLGALARALGALRLTAAPTWATLQRAGVLRVGTTGDYAPFSEERNAELRGLDLELAQALANAWGLRVIFVRTSWPTLMADLGARRFDVALSGISITEERRRLADFSAAYLFDGKTPIARAADAARFSSLEKIDQPGVRVIVNPGGTNERFARERLTRATILVHADNRSIFAEIIAGRADVMITDGIEVRLQERRHPELRGTMTEPLTRAAKAVLLPKDSDLTARTDTWLKRRIENMPIADDLARALDAAAQP